DWMCDRLVLGERIWMCDRVLSVIGSLVHVPREISWNVMLVVVGEVGDKECDRLLSLISH
ncbi:MAG: hypothetical protein ACLFWI_10940, partial [Coleofasciculus sp.]|uniref:hypothetical protein n=1 Tax=Coleofasciculus sp. TaxID=3100458 RepID=UPI003A14D385